MPARSKTLAALGAILIIVASSGVSMAVDVNSREMFNVPGLSDDPTQIDFDALPVLPAQRSVVFQHGIDQGDGVLNFSNHAYTTYFDGQYWAMWSQNFTTEEQPGQHLGYATSPDGVNWSTPAKIVEPPSTAPGSPRYISRGLWVRDGKLHALASRIDGEKQYWIGNLDLMHFQWNPGTEQWDDAGLLIDNTLSNFPPQQTPDGRWMTSRRDTNKDVSVILGGVNAVDEWTVYDVPPAENGEELGEPTWWTLPDGTLSMSFRDDTDPQSKKLYRSFSTDNGETWSTPIQTDFPDAGSKTNVLKTSTGTYVLVNNPNGTPGNRNQTRNPLTLSVSADGEVFTNIAVLPTGHASGNVQYPHITERDGHLLIAYNYQYQDIETLKVPLSEVDALLANASPLTIAMDTEDAAGITSSGLTGNVSTGWAASTVNPTYLGENYWATRGGAMAEGEDGKWVRFDPDLPEAGLYHVEMFWNDNDGQGRASNVPIDIRDSDGLTMLTLDQSDTSIGDLWHRLGTFNYQPGDSFYVEVRNDGADSFVVVDGMRFVLVPEPGSLALLGLAGLTLATRRATARR